MSKTVTKDDVTIIADVSDASYLPKMIRWMKSHRNRRVKPTTDTMLDDNTHTPTNETDLNFRGRKTT
jgi:hypothetical protein